MVSRIACGLACSHHQLPEVAVLGKAVVAPGRGKDEAALFDNLRRGGHALHGLVQVLVERVAAVGRHDNRVRAIAANHRRRFRERASFHVGRDGSPQKKPVISRRRFSVTLTEKSTGRSEPLAGLWPVLGCFEESPGAARVADADARWYIMMESMSATAGNTPLYPPGSPP